MNTKSVFLLPLFFIIMRSQQALSQDLSCTTSVANWFNATKLEPCAACHSENSASAAPKWLFSDPTKTLTALDSIWKSNNASTANESLLLLKPKSSQLSHGGGKNFPADTIDTLQAGLDELIGTSCLENAAAQKIQPNHKALPTFLLFRQRFETLSGPESKTSALISQYGRELGRPDYKGDSSFKLKITPMTVGIIDRIVYSACAEMADQRGWKKMDAAALKKEIAHLIQTTIGLRGAGIEIETERVMTFAINNTLASNERKSFAGPLACGIVLRSEKFLFP